METTYVYVVYKVEDSDCEDLRVFASHREAKWYVTHHEGNYRIWQRPIEERA